MDRRTLSLPTTLSLMMCVATCSLWVRSYEVQDTVGWCRADPATPDRHLTYNLSTVQGTIGLGTINGPTAVLNEVSPGFFYRSIVPEPDASPAGGAEDFWSRAGFGFGRVDVRWLRLTMEGACVPMWLAAAVTGLLPSAAVARNVRRRLRACDNLCPTCGYDLRATPSRCPECGTPPTTSF